MSTPTPPSPEQAADTYDWDTAYGIRFVDANRAIVNAGSSPANFSGTYTDPIFGTVYPVTGDFGPWQLCAGGDGSDVNMEIPVSNFTLGKQVLGATVVIQVKMNLLPQPTPTAAGNHNLRLKTTTTDALTEPVVSIQTVQMVAPAPATMGTVVSSVLGPWFLANIQSFNHVFAAVDLNQTADTAAFQWLKPTKISYAVVAPLASVGADDNILGILAMTENRDNPALADQISPNIIPAGANAGFLISQERFITKFFLPGVCKLFNNASASDFAVTEDGSSVTNTAALSLGQLEFGDGTIVTDAQIDTGNFILTALDSQLQIQMTDIHFTWQSGYTVHLTYAGSAVLSLGADNHFQMQETGTPSITATVVQSTASKWTDIAINVVIGVAASVAGALLGSLATDAATLAAKAAETAATDAANAAATAAADSASFAVDGVASAAESTTDEAEAASEEAAEDAADEQGSDRVTNAGNSSYVTKFTGYFKSNWRIILGLAIGGAAGSVIGAVPKIVQALSEKGLTDVPTLDDFADEAVAPTAWPGATGTTLVSASLNKSLQLGIDITH